MNIDDIKISDLAKIALALGHSDFVTTPRDASISEGLLSNVTQQYVVVCTDKRGVVFGLTEDVTARPIRLTGARMCLYWSADVGGVFGLAENGPTKGCKISAVCPSLLLEGVTAIFTCDPKAVQAWTDAKVQGR